METQVYMILWTSDNGVIVDVEYHHDFMEAIKEVKLGCVDMPYFAEKTKILCVEGFAYKGFSCKAKEIIKK